MVFASANIHIMANHVSKVSKNTHSFDHILEMYLQFKFTKFTLFAACLLLIVLGACFTILVRICCETMCCRKKEYGVEEDSERDANGNSKYQTIQFNHTAISFQRS